MNVESRYANDNSGSQFVPELRWSKVRAANSGWGEGGDTKIQDEVDLDVGNKIVQGHFFLKKSGREFSGPKVESYG